MSGASATNPANSGVVTAVFPTAHAIAAQASGFTLSADQRTASFIVTAGTERVDTLRFSGLNVNVPAGYKGDLNATIDVRGETTAGELLWRQVDVVRIASVDVDPLAPPIPPVLPPAPVAINLAVVTGLTAPATGATPDLTIDETAQFTGTVTWSPADATFVAGKVYTATVTLTAKEGFTLAAVGGNFFLVPGATAAVNAAGSGAVSYTHLTLPTKA